MRIGYDAKRAFKNFSGLGNYSRAVISIMAQYYDQHEYVLYTTPYAAHPLQGFADKLNISIREPKGIWRLLHSVWRSLRLSKDISKDRIDIYHGLSHELPVGIQRTSAKSVVTMHDLIVLRYPHLYKPIDRQIYMKKYKASCNAADLIIAISEQTKADLIHFMHIDERKIRLVYQGCDPQFYDIKSTAEKEAVKQKYSLPDNYILSVGTIEPRKSLATIVRALAQLPTAIHLVAVGKPTPYLNIVQAEVQRLDLHNRMHFIHNAAFADLPAIYQQAIIFVYSSLFEGFGIPILEALNSRVPVVAANTSSLPEVGGDAALYIEPDDDKTLATHLYNILNDTTLRQSMVEKGLVQAATFNEDKIARSLWSVYEELQ